MNTISETERYILTKTGHWYFYLLLCRQHPWTALKEIAGCALIFAALFILLYVEEIARCAERLLP